MERLVAIVDEGTLRQPEHPGTDSASSSPFSQLCLRKLYVLCSRGAEASAPQGCLLQVNFCLPSPCNGVLCSLTLDMAVQGCVQILSDRESPELSCGL